VSCKVASGFRLANVQVQLPISALSLTLNNIVYGVFQAESACAAFLQVVVVPLALIAHHNPSSTQVSFVAVKSLPFQLESVSTQFM